MGDKFWAVNGALYGTIGLIVNLVLFLVGAALCVAVVVGAIDDIWSTLPEEWAAHWQGIAIFLIFVWTFQIRRRVKRLDEMIEQVRMMVFATASYLDFGYGNAELDKLKGLGPASKRGFWRMWMRLTGHGDLADDILQASRAARYGRYVTLSDDLQRFAVSPHAD